MTTPPYQNRDWLHQKYITEGLSTLKIAPLAKCGKSTIQAWLDKFKIPRRHGGPTGPKKPFVTSVHGYKLIYTLDHPRVRAKRGGGHITPSPYVGEHILVVEKQLGRFLTKAECIHHKDGNRANNNPDNLQLFADAQGHSSYERLLGSFIKKLLWGEIHISNREEIFQLLEHFVKEQD